MARKRIYIVVSESNNGFVQIDRVKASSEHEADLLVRDNYRICFDNPAHQIARIIQIIRNTTLNVRTIEASKAGRTAHA